MSSPANPTAPSPPLLTGLRRAGLLYGQIFNTGVQSTLTYRWNFLFRSAMSFVPLIGSYYLWGAVFAAKSDLTGYSYSLMMAYYISLVVHDMITWPSDQDFQIAEDIKEGRISMALIKPINYQGYRLTLHIAAICLNFVLSLIPIALVVLVFGRYFSGVPFSQTAAPAALAIAGSAMVQFAISYCIAMIAFWTLEITTASIFIFSLEYFAGGHVFPLDILPAPLYHAAMSFPFAYEYFFPMGVLLGRIQGADIVTGFIWMTFWIVFFFALGHALWTRGLKKYTSVGG